MRKYSTIFQRILPEKTIISLIEQHASYLIEASKYIKKALNNYMDRIDDDDLIESLSSIERKADGIKNEFRDLLRKALKLSFEREDLLEFIHIQDNVIDSLEDFGKLISLNLLEISITEDIKTLLFELVDEVIKSIDEYYILISNLEKTLYLSYSKKIIEKQIEIINNLSDIEHKIDLISLKLGKWAFSRKNELNAIDIIHFNNLVIILSKIPNMIARLADKILDFLK